MVEDIVEEATRLVRRAAAQGVAIRLLGGIAVRILCPETANHPALRREYKDIDIAATRRDSKRVREILIAEGYEPDQRFNAMQAGSRMLFHDRRHERQVDIFLGRFEMCHALDLEPALAASGPALSPAELLLLKLQIVQLNRKDVTDSLALLLQHAPPLQSGQPMLDTAVIARLAGADWGWYTTLHDNLETVAQHAPTYLKPPEAETVRSHISTLLAAMETAPKSLGWRMRDKIGRRKIWYEQPEEVAR